MEVAQLGPDFLILTEPMSHPPCEATVVLRVDAADRLCPVRLPHGISGASPRVTLALAEGASAVAA